MKIEGPNKTQGSAPAKKKGKVSEGGPSFEDFMTQGASSSSGAEATRQIAGVDALLAVQAAEDPTERAARRRMRERSDKILDGLEAVRMGMLTGSLTVGHMVDIADVVASHREKVSDPSLVAVMDEIDLRAQVELAKMRVSMERSPNVPGGSSSF